MSRAAEGKVLVSNPPPTRSLDRVASARSAGIESAGSCLRAAARFLAGNWIAVVVISVVLLIPCFWHRHIEAGDLASHVYNAWLAQLVSRGQAPGLWIAPQTNNILFDLMLSGFGRLFGLYAAEKISVAIAVLLFFWGAFALTAAAAKRPSWTVVPILAMLAYGWLFHVGFFNFYLSLALSFFALAIVWHGNRRDSVLAAFIMLLVWVAHPLGIPFVIGAAAYLIAVRLRLLPQAALFLIGIAALFLLRKYAAWRYGVSYWTASAYLRTGIDQLIIDTSRYHWLAISVLVAAVTLVLIDSVQSWRSGELRFRLSVPLQLYFLAVAGMFMLPESLTIPRYDAPVLFVVSRFSPAVAVLGCCVLATIRPRKWHVAPFAAIAVVFFVLLYADTQKVERMEQQAETLVQQVPPGQRVISSIYMLPDLRIFLHHMVDRACIGHCFSYANYEPSSKQFRVRAEPGNRIVAASAEDADAMVWGDYDVRPEDLPLYQVYQCDETGTKLCIRQLTTGPSAPPDASDEQSSDNRRTAETPSAQVACAQQSMARFKP
jgi:hypothetical protein